MSRCERQLSRAEERVTSFLAERPPSNVWEQAFTYLTVHVRLTIRPYPTKPLCRAVAGGKARLPSFYVHTDQVLRQIDRTGVAVF